MQKTISVFNIKIKEPWYHCVYRGSNNNVKFLYLEIPRDPKINEFHYYATSDFYREFQL